jgi:hypothetical protein
MAVPTVMIGGASLPHIRDTGKGGSGEGFSKTLRECIICWEGKAALSLIRSIMLSPTAPGLADWLTYRL